jgi:uncharacterized protein (TIGR02452 family)
MTKRFSKSDLSEIFNDTYSLSKSTYKYLGKINNLSPNFSIVLEPRPVSLPKPSIIITKGDCLEDAKTLVGKTLVINSASMLNRGGGVERGSMAQEESICRRSNLYNSLENLDYPLFNKTRGVYSPNVTVLKSADYKILKTPYQIDILSVFSRPISKIKNETEQDVLYDTILQSIWYICNKYEIENLVFVPVGCGVFGHDPYYVADSLLLYLNKYKLNTVKKVVVSCFTCIENYDAFKYYFL